MNLDFGNVSGVVGDQVVVESAGKLPDLGIEVFIRNGRLGPVADIIGDVKKPYFVVRKVRNIDVKIGEIVSSD